MQVNIKQCMCSTVQVQVEAERHLIQQHCLKKRSPLFHFKGTADLADQGWQKKKMQGHPQKKLNLATIIMKLKLITAIITFQSCKIVYKLLSCVLVL